MANEIDGFLKSLEVVKLDNCFNPYADRCKVYDLPNAFEVRKENLRLILERCASAPVVDLWVGRDLGHKGGRRTGIALLDELQMDAYASKLGIGLLSRATTGKPVKEQTATSVAQAMENCSVPILTWNVFPFHPHNSGCPFSNRSHTLREAQIGCELLLRLTRLVSIRYVVAIGADAKRSMAAIGQDIKAVRHPSFGGKNSFLEQMKNIYPAPAKPVKQLSFHLD
ncbi:uracil-DNA glycosylase [Aureimonas sp. N4]|uniref:uracil-DNA glycosylase n=1 Tax=Aureimonas sp. N4 TaxID=1638165 RepID=UPI000B13203A|nr:uracil-DNA glycosylase [Aureimonas sp. N4]